MPAAAIKGNVQSASRYASGTTGAAFCFDSVRISVASVPFSRLPG